MIMMRYFYIMCKYEEAFQCGRHASEYLPAYKGFKDELDYYYMYSLTLLALCKTSRPFPTDKETDITKGYDKATEKTSCQHISSRQLWSQEECNEYLEVVIENQKKFKKYSDMAPMNYRHQYLLVEAELARVR